eukprot:1139044-Pelagomonas_calceolata.AAC.15
MEWRSFSPSNGHWIEVEKEPLRCKAAARGGANRQSRLYQWAKQKEAECANAGQNECKVSKKMNAG